MHRTVKGRHLLCRSAEVNGTKTKSLRYRCVKSLTDSKRTGQGKRSLLGSQTLYIGVLSDDFAAVDLREELCYHSRPKKEKFGGGLLRFIDFLESVFYGGGAVIDFPVSAKILIILR